MSDDNSNTPETPPTVATNAPSSPAPKADALAAIPTAKMAEATSKDPKVQASEPSKAETKAAETVAEAKRKFKVKIDQEEKEVDEDELLRGYQLRQASDKRFKEASQKYKEAEQFLELLKKNPRAVLSHPDVGHDVRKLAEEILAEELENELMDPKDKEIRQLRKEKADREEKEKQAAEAARQAKEAEEVKGYEAAYVNDIESTIKTSGLPMNIHTVNAVRDYMLIAMEQGNHDIKAADVIADVKKDYQDAVKSLFSTTDVSALVGMLGEESLKKIRDFDIARLKVPTKKASEPVKVKPEPAAEKPFVTVNEYFDALKKRIG